MDHRIRREHPVSYCDNSRVAGRKRKVVAFEPPSEGGPGSHASGMRYRCANRLNVIRRLVADGWDFGRTRGSHHQYGYLTRHGLVTVLHTKRGLPIGTLQTIATHVGLDFGEGRNTATQGELFSAVTAGQYLQVTDANWTRVTASGEAAANAATHARPNDTTASNPKTQHPPNSRD